MVPTSQVALAILLLTIAPGFILLATWARNRTWKGPSSDLRTIIQSLVLSAVVQALLAPLTVFWILPVDSKLSSHPWRVAIWIILSVIVVPIALGVAASRVQDKLFNPSDLFVKGKFATRVSEVFEPSIAPTVWDWLFTSDRFPDSCFMVVGFEDGTRVAGAFAGKSMALTTPESQGLYLEREWALDANGDVDVEVSGTAGLLIPEIDKVQWVRILKS